ncbi:MAG: LLM class flavin-dependent oxidoreductase [Deltaproteobacteria bacterium]|nr:LLM class flavin-dependent oxidoreductase [Deltaproteobacteria bacterium]
MTDLPLPAVALAAVPGRRKATLELAREIERRGFSGIYCATYGDGVGLCEALALVTERIPFGTAIANIYTRHVSEYAMTASLIQELSNGRFRFGVGVSHVPFLARIGLEGGKPLADMRRFVEDLRAVPRAGELPPLVVAGLRKKMVALSAEIGEGVVFANACRSHMSESLAALPEEKRGSSDFFIGNMIPTCISEDRKAAAAVNRKTLSGYLPLPNYRNYWKEAGYVEEMEAVEKALANREREKIPSLLSDRWLADATLFGTATEVREGVEAWYEAGVRTPMLVPSSAVGNQMKAFEELFAIF